MKRRTVLGLLAAVVAIAAVVDGWFIVRRGFSAREQPSWIETLVARSVRRVAVPARTRNLPNPIPLTSGVLVDARAHFADHCATCHANDGSGNTIVGRNLYPKAPDMRLADTQQLTDGELYAIIQDGIRLTGMPAWGKAGDETDEDSWKLVHLIRHLKDLTPEQLTEMKHMNPKSPDDLQEEKAEEEFLRGGGTTTDEKPSEKPSQVHQH
jgi:mono/diheme cytochrome c family protein